MFCTNCGYEVEKTDKFCRECGQKLIAKPKTSTQDVTSSAPQASVTGAVKHQRDNEDQFPSHKHPKEEPEETQEKGQLTSEESDGATRDDTSKQELSDSAASAAAVDTSATPSPPHQAVSDDHLLTTRKPQVTESRKEEERPSGAECPPQTFAAAVKSNLAVSSSVSSPSSSSEKITPQQTSPLPDTGADNYPNVVRVPAEKSNDNAKPPSNSASPTSSVETGAAVPDLSEQTAEECAPVRKQPSSEIPGRDKKTETQQPSRRPGDQSRNENQTKTGQQTRGQGRHPNVQNASLTDGTAVPSSSTQGQLTSEESDGATRDDTSKQEPSDSAASAAAVDTSATPSPPHQAVSDDHLLTTRKPQVTESRKEEERPSGAECPPQTFAAVVKSNPAVSSSVSSPSSSSEKITPQQTAPVRKQPSSEKPGRDKKTETQQSSGRPEDPSRNQTKTGQQTRGQGRHPNVQNAIQTDGTAAPSSSTQADDNKADGSKNTQLANKLVQQPLHGGVDVPRSPTPSTPASQSNTGTRPPVVKDERSRQTETPQASPSAQTLGREHVSVYFHAVTSKELHLDPSKDMVFLKSGGLFGDWDTQVKMTFTRDLGEGRFLVEGRLAVEKTKIYRRIPYKYIVYKHHGNNYVYEVIYQKDGNQMINRCLSVNLEFLTHEGEWHQYDDVIYPELKKAFFGLWDNTKAEVMKGRERAGRVMLGIIFDLLTTWNQPNLENFFILLQQFFVTYCYPLLHDVKERPWGLPYGEEQVKNLLKDFLHEHIIPQQRQKGERPEALLPPLHAGIIALLVYYKYLRESIGDQLSNLCDLLRLPCCQQQQEFLTHWEHFTRPLPDQKGIADAVEMLCNYARHNNIEKWILVIPLIHLLRGDSKPFEPVPPVLPWTGHTGSTGAHAHNTNLIKIMEDNSYLADIDHLLVPTWMSLLSLNDVVSLKEFVSVELLDILHHMLYSLQNGNIYYNYMAAKNLVCYLLNRERNKKISYDDSYGELCLKTATRLLCAVCQHTTEPDRCEIPMHLLDLVCLIAGSYDCANSQLRERVHEEVVGEMLGTLKKWRRTTFRNKLLNVWTHTHHLDFASQNEIGVWNKLISLSFNHEQLTASWRATFSGDFEGKLKQESTMHQIGLYCDKNEELREKMPLLCNSMEKCALDAVNAICQDKSGKAVSALVKKHDIAKFGKLMSVIVMKSWPTDTNGHYVEGEESVIEYLLNWPMAKTVLQMTGSREKLMDKLSDEAQIRMILASSAFKSVSEKFLKGNIQIKTLNQILENEHEFAELLKIDGLCDDGRCKDDRNMRRLLRQRRAEAEAVRTDKELIKDLLQICQELPKHVTVDFKGLDKTFKQNTEVMTLDEFMEVHRLDRDISAVTGVVTYFDLSDNTRQMAAELHSIKESLIFKMCWANQVEELSRDQGDPEDPEDPEQLDGNEEVYTVDLIYSKIFQNCYKKYRGIYEGLKSGDLSLEEVDSITEVYKGSYDDMEKDLQIMCRISASDNRKWIRRRIHQIEQYQNLHLAVESAGIIMDISKTICPEGNFEILQTLSEMDDADFRKKSLNYIDDTLMETTTILRDITDDRRECLQELRQRKNFVLWVKEALEDINELKVFVDLASIYAGENDLDVDRVACFHDAVLGYSSMLYGLESHSDFQAFQKSLSKLWKALENDRNIPNKLRDTARHLEWLKTVKESHGSVELSSLSLATSINKSGVYIIKAQNQKKLTLETSLTLQIEEGRDKNMMRTYELEDLRELQNKLMLMSGRGEQNQSEVDCFVEVFDNVQRLATAFVDLHAAGNPLFRCWEARIYCKTQSDPCISMEFKFCKTHHQLQVCGKLVEQFPLLSKKMELFLEDWLNFMDKQRSEHYYLNYFTAEQIFYLCSVLTPTNVDAEIEDKALMMLSVIKPNCTASDVWRIWTTFCNQFQTDSRTNEATQFQSLFHRQQERDDMSLALESQATTEDLSDNVNQAVGLRELEELWNGYMTNVEIVFHDFLDIRSLGGLLEMMTITENKNEWEEPELSETRDNSVRRKLPKGLLPSQPNLVICPHDQILESSICLYMSSDYEPLPSYDEVLLCDPATPCEQVELFLRRCLTPGYVGQKIYTILRADQLSYDVSCAMERCFQKLGSQGKDNYMLVIYCSSDREHTYIPTAFSRFKRDFVPQEPLDRIQKYLSRHYSVASDSSSAASVFKDGQSVGIVYSKRAGVGKSLYIRRLYEQLEGGVQDGNAFKKCIRLTEAEVDDHKILQSLYDTPRDKDHKVFHFDVTSSVRKGLNEFLFKLFFLRNLMDSDGLMWQCTHKHLYIIELLDSMQEQPKYATRYGRKENFAFFEVFPKVFCRSPKEVLALEVRTEDNPHLDTDDPLMDDEYFRSEAYQRPYQYLTRFHNGDNLDNFTYHGIEGSHAECLQILFLYCGIIDPSWAELQNFVWFLNLQLQDCENSVFCKHELVGDTLDGFKNFVVEFMILMSKDFATPSLCITDQSSGRQQIDLSQLNERDLAPFLIRKRWESEPHPYIFFNDDHMSMTFIGFHLERNNQNGYDAINPSTREVIKKNIMTRELYTGLRLQRVPFNMNFDQLSRADKIEHLCSVLGIKWPTDPDETYELTTDNILKMMAIHMRFRCGIPVIIMGETGCGKTRLIKFMCELRRCGAPTENMKLVKVHGGTTSEMIYAKVQEGEILAGTNKEEHGFDTILFFDEANTTEAISSIKEIICDNTVQGQQLDSDTGLQIIAACNPYRKHTDRMIERLEESGLGYRVRAEETEDRLGSIPLRQLVYRVQMLPPSMIPLVWDFGQLNDLTEQMYIEQIVQRQLGTNLIDMSYVRKITEVLSSSQKFMRERKDECSFVSLRDVERCMQVFVWFHRNHSIFVQELRQFLQKQPRRPNKKNEQLSSPASDRVIWSLLMATAVCYQSCLESKGQYQIAISQILRGEYNPQRVRKEIQLIQDLLLNGVPMGETIARNEALKENVFMMVICIELRIPLFIVGKPGSSKSLSKTLVADAMQGSASHSELFKRLKQIHLVSFQCSPHSTPEGIINTFKQCARFQESKNLDEYISVVVLDEIGLAEDSPKMPLKTLHPLLEEGCIDDEPLPHKRVGFVGISNWALDPAKMNRGIFVSRGDPNEHELIKSAKGICSSEAQIHEMIKHLFKPFANAYMTICTEGKGFFGLRDFYSLVKMVFSITKATKQNPTADQITGAVLRNFSGRDDVDVMSIFSKELTEDFTNTSISALDLLEQSISPDCQAHESRYLLILTKNYAALQILQQMFFNDQIHPEIIFGSSFPKDQEYTQICRNINRVKVCMETGQTVVLLNLQNLYESLYDALNQYYVTLGGQKYVDLGLGTHRVKCRVHKNFRLIVIEEKEVVYKQFPIPLINRLEKHYVDINTVLRDEQKDMVKLLQTWVHDFVSSCSQHSMTKQYVPSDVFIGYHSDTCSSVVLQVTEQLNDAADAQNILDKAKGILLNCATPDSVVRLDNSRLPDDEREYLVQEYVRGDRHRSLSDFIVSDTQQAECSDFCFTEVTTFSRLLTATDTQQLQNVTKFDIKLLSLHQFDTEYSFLKKIREFLGSIQADKVLIIQTDYDEGNHSRNILSSAKYSCINEINKWAMDTTKTFVYFVTKLPRVEGGTSFVGFQGGPWRSVHIDDLRRSREFVSDVHTLKNLRISQLFADPPEGMETDDANCVLQNREPTILADMFDTMDLVRSCVQSAVSMLRDVAADGELSTRRVENLLTLLEGSETQAVFVNTVRKRLHALLEDYEAMISLPKNWVLREASNINALQEGGTFMHTLWRKVQSVVTPLLANLVSVIDRNHNLDLLINSGEDVRNLWLQIFACKEMLDVPYIRMESNSMVFVVPSRVTADNTLRCVMPFSSWIKDFLDVFMMQTLKHENQTLGHFEDLFKSLPLGHYMAHDVSDQMKKEFFQRYLQDFVSLQMTVATDDELKLLCDALTSCVNELQRRRNREESPSLPHIHRAYHLYHSRLQNLLRMISLHPRIAPALQRNQQRCPEMVLDVHAALACVECMEPPALDTDACCQNWLKAVKQLQGSMELICSQNNPRLYGERCKERLHDIRNGWRRIYILSLFVEHMLLGFDRDEKQLRKLLLDNICVLGKVLAGNSDLKSERAFQAVIKVLTSCKQGASEQLCKFGLQCAVCMREPQDPVQLPCQHVWCLVCCRRSLDTGQTSCPVCRQQIPPDFNPEVSEHIRASIKKNAEFSQRCNAFFIDLVSTVCFKDNIPPTGGVIRHLLSYLMVETENNEIHTKDLSPFDESMDKNPVVRSVILKLLLKFSFDEVKEYLQQHLTSVEDSRIVDEGDKAELYALYINCLEDSMWEKMPQEGNKAEELQPFLTEETQFLHHFLGAVAQPPAAVSIQHLQHVARLRLCLTLAAQLISDMLSGNAVPDGAEEFLRAVVQLCEQNGNDWYRIYLIRKLSSWQGVELVQTLVKNPEFSWLFPMEILQKNEDGGQMDQYLVYGEDYKAVRDAVAKAVITGSVEEIEDVCETCPVPPRRRTLFILLALFREVTTLYRSANTGFHPSLERCQAFAEFIQGSAYLHNNQVRHFATALVHNRLGALSVNCNHSTVHNVLVELVVHLAAVLLTGTHWLLLPLQQLGMSPDKMLGAFIPTMPDDMLAVAQSVITQGYGQLTWYVCPNNHPCFVDECGLPMQRGRCLECGQEVGGENHAALPGFRPMGQQQGDRTRRGHILGQPERRNNPDTLDTKTMSLTPFTLVRLLTHLAMLLGASEKAQFVQQIIQPPVQDVCLFLTQHLLKDMEQLTQALGRGADDTVTTIHLMLRSLLGPMQVNLTGLDPCLPTKESRNAWEMTVAAEVLTPQLKGLNKVLRKANKTIRNDSRVSSNPILGVTSGDECSFLRSLPRGSPLHSSAVWSCRERLSLLSLMHIVEHNDQKEKLPLLWTFLQKETEFRQVTFLPDILALQRNLVRKFQNASDQILGTIGEFIEKQRGTAAMKTWYEKHIHTFLKTWNLLRVSVATNEMKIPEEFCSEDLDLRSDLRYLLPRRQGPGLCATALVSHLVALHNELVYAVDSHTGEDSSSYRVSVEELTELHVIRYDVEKDLLPLVLSNCQYSMERGHETLLEYDLPRIQQHIITRFLQGKPLITRTGVPTLVNTHERDYETIFKAVKGKVPQEPLSSLTRNAVSRELDSYSEVCEAHKTLELLLGFLSMTGGSPMMPLVTYLQDTLKMANQTDPRILKALGRCCLKHCASLWQLLMSLKSERMLHLKREPFSGHPAEYQEPLKEEEKRQLKSFVSKGNMDRWLLEMHEFLCLSLASRNAPDTYSPLWSVKEAVAAYMDRKEVDVPGDVEAAFPDSIQLSQIVEAWKYAVTAKQEWMM